MNKETVYIEPEDDITDIISKIEKAKEKIVALVPPKKAGVFRSVVNIKLIAKAAKSADKTVVLVTVDPSITKLAAASKLPVAKNLQSAPSVPELENEEADTEETTDVDEDGKEVNSDDEDSDDEAEESDEDADEEESDEEIEEEVVEEKSKKSKKKKKSDKKGGRLKNWIREHKKLSILIGILVVGIIGFLVWAFGFAPAVDIAVSIKTDAKNFSDGITFVDSLDKENAKEGKIYLEQKKIETVQEVQFEATGKKNRGVKATGKVKVSVVFSGTGSIAINAGTLFTNNGLSFSANEYHGLSWDGDEDKCENDKKLSVNPDGSMSIRCLISEEVNVTATEGGTKYNIAATSTGWDTISGASVVSTSPMTGGTDDTITVVQQADVENAKNQIRAAKEEENKQKLYESIPDDSLIIENTFKQETSTAVATPGVDEEVKDGVKPTLKATTTAIVYIIDKTKLEEYINSKVDLRDDQKIIEIRDIYIDGFSDITSGASGKLKAKYYVGPRITESEVVDKIKGRGLGDAQRALRDIEGVSDVKIDKSYPWVFTVPGNTNKVKVTFEITDQNGEKIEEKKEGEEGENGGEEGENSENSENSEENNENKENQ